METLPYAMNGVVLNGTASNGAQNATVKKAPVAPATVEPNVIVEPQMAETPVEKPMLKRSARTEETGHTINWRNFGRIIDAVISYGPSYVTNYIALQLDSLEALYEEVNTSLIGVRNKKTIYEVAIDVQHQEFENLKPICTMALNNFEICGASKIAIGHLKNANAKIQGQRIIKVDVNVEDDNTISVSRQSYAQQTAHFEDFIDILEQNAGYNPGNADLTAVALTAKKERMLTKYRAVEMTLTELKSGRISRDVTMYKNETGMVDTAYAVKKTVLSLYGSKSPQYKLISGLGFRRPPKYKNL